MKYIDQHVHSNISHDGISTFKEHMIYAKEHSISEITFTEHYDDYIGIDTNLETLNVDNYKKEYLNNKNDNIIKTNFGIEIGLRPESTNKIKNMVKNNNFDFIIGSSHITCGKDMAYDKSFFDNLTPQESIKNYLNEVLENIKLYKNEFDVYGHLDYVIRYVINYYGNIINKLNYSDFKELLDEILTLLLKNDKGIEINTSGIRYGLGYCHPNEEILKRYIELGGKIVTIGSDAHKSSDLARDFNKVYDLLDYLDINDIAVYHNRKPSFIKVKKLR